MEPAGVAGAGVAWPARGGPGDGSLIRELSSPPSMEPPHKKVRNNTFQAPGSMYPSQDAANHMRGDVQGVVSQIPHALPTHAAGEQGYGGRESFGFAGQAPFNHSQGMQQAPEYGGQQQMQPSNGYSQDTSHVSSHSFSMPPQNSTPPSGFPPGSAKGTGALFLKTKLCTKFKLGTCTFNERCHFAHGMEDLRKPPVGWETMVANAGQGGLFAGRMNDGQQRKKSSKPCRFFADGKECPYGDRCTFVHTTGDDAHTALGFGSSESGGMPAASYVRFKTRMCARWEKGEPCNYGERCHYAHGYAELQTSTGAPAYGDDNVTTDNNMQYASSNLEVAPYSAQFSNVNPMNAPTAPPSLGGPYSVPNANAPPNAYPTAGIGAQETINDYSRNQSYWNGAPTQPGYNQTTQPGYNQATQPGYNQATQPGYIQANQMAGLWAGNHIVEGGYSKDPTSAVQYIPAQVQQPSVQPYASGSAGVYQEQPKQSASLPYVQDGNRATYQADPMGGKGGYYPAPYVANHPN